MGLEDMAFADESVGNARSHLWAKQISRGMRILVGEAAAKARHRFALDGRQLALVAERVTKLSVK